MRFLSSKRAIQTIRFVLGFSLTVPDVNVFRIRNIVNYCEKMENHNACNFMTTRREKKNVYSRSAYFLLEASQPQTVAQSTPPIGE